MCTDQQLLDSLRLDLKMFSHLMSRFQIAETKIRIKYLEDKLNG